jgi:protein-tyrosine-phosphatase
MAAGYMRALGKGKVTVLSAGSAPKDSINPVAINAMAEEGIDISSNVPQALTQESLEASDIVITMGCGDVCPYDQEKRHEDWVLTNPFGKTMEDIRPIRDEIRQRVEKLLSDLV